MAEATDYKESSGYTESFSLRTTRRGSLRCRHTLCTSRRTLLSMAEATDYKESSDYTESFSLRTTRRGSFELVTPLCVEEDLTQHG